MAKQLSREYKSAGVGVIVLDPFHSSDWQADVVTADSEHFLNVLWDSQSCACFIDEAADAVGRYDDAMRQTATRGRHWGHNMHYISQRGSDLNKTVRDQCDFLFMFKLSYKDRQTLAQEFDKDELLEELDRYAYVKCDRYNVVEKRTVSP